MAVEGKDKKYIQGCTGSSGNSNQWKKQYQSSSLSKLSKSVFTLIKEKKIKIQEGGKKKDHRRKTKLILMHGLSPFKRLPPRAESSLLAPCHTGHRWEESPEQPCSNLAGGQKNSKVVQSRRGGKSNAGGVLSRRWQFLKWLKAQ